MEAFLSIVNFVSANYQAIIAAIVGLLSGVIGVALLLPGSEPESTLQKIVDFIAKFSRK